jgi:hypothetical protein
MSILPAESYLGFIALGFGTGDHGTLSGAGGGFVLMPVLLLLHAGKDPEMPTSLSLAIVFLTPFKLSKHRPSTLPTFQPPFAFLQSDLEVPYYPSQKGVIYPIHYYQSTRYHSSYYAASSHCMKGEIL